jgi:hypothetical protein
MFIGFLHSPKKKNARNVFTNVLLSFIIFPILSFADEVHCCDSSCLKAEDSCSDDDTCDHFHFSPF